MFTIGKTYPYLVFLISLKKIHCFLMFAVFDTLNTVHGVRASPWKTTLFLCFCTWVWYPPLRTSGPSGDKQHNLGKVGRVKVHSHGGQWRGIVKFMHSLPWLHQFFRFTKCVPSCGYALPVKQELTKSLKNCWFYMQRHLKWVNNMQVIILK